MRTAAKVAALMGGGKPEINKVCPAITPATTGAELLTNPGFEGVYVGGVAPNWVKGGSPTVAESADVHGGSSAQSFIPAAVNNSLAVMSATGWVQFSCWGKRTAGTDSMAGMCVFNGTTDLYGPTYTDAAYTQKTMTYLGTGAPIARAIMQGFGAGGDTVIIDDASLKALDLASMMSYLGTRSGQDGTFSCAPTVAVGTGAGMVVNYQDSNNFALVMVNRSRLWGDGHLILIKRAAGTYTQVAIGNVTYGAGKVVKLIVSGTTYKMYYNGVQVGADQTINDIGSGKAVYGFSTLAANSVGTVTTSKATA